MRTLCKTSNSLYTVFIERGKLCRHDFLILYFCVANLSKRILTLDRVSVWGKNVCGNSYLRMTAKIAKNIVPHGIYLFQINGNKRKLKYRKPNK